MSVKYSVQVSGLKELRQALRQLPDDLRKQGQKELKEANQFFASKVVGWAAPQMPSDTGTFRRGYKAKRTITGVVVENKVPYAYMIEGIGPAASMWRSQSGKFVRVPMPDGKFAMMKRAVIWRSRGAGRNWSNYIIPAVKAHEAELAREYGAKIAELFSRYCHRGL